MSILRPLRRSDRVPDKAYLNFIRSLECCVCANDRVMECGCIQQHSRTEAAHTGPHGIGSKSDDRTAIPLCCEHHREGLDSYHRLGPSLFQQIHGINIAATVAELNERFDAEAGRGTGVPDARVCL